MDQTVKRIRPKDYELSTVQDNLANAVDELSSGVSDLRRKTFLARSIVRIGTVWNSAYTALTMIQTGETVVNGANGSVGVTPFIMKFTEDVKVTGFSLNQAGPISGVNFLVILKNAIPLYTWNAGSGGNNSTFWINGLSFKYLKGDTLTCSYYNSTSGNTQVLAHLTIETSA